MGALRARETHSRKGPRAGADREREYVQGGGRCEFPRESGRQWSRMRCQDQDSSCLGLVWCFKLKGRLGGAPLQSGGFPRDAQLQVTKHLLVAMEFGVPPLKAQTPLKRSSCAGPLTVFPVRAGGFGTC